MADQGARLRAISHIQDEASRLWEDRELRKDLANADWNDTVITISTDNKLFSSAFGLLDAAACNRIEVGLCIGTARRAVAEGIHPMDPTNRTRMERELWPMSNWRNEGLWLKPVMALPDYARVLQLLVSHHEIKQLVDAWEAADLRGDDDARGENFNQIEKLAAAIKLRFGHWNGAKFAHASSAALRGEIDPFDLSRSTPRLLELNRHSFGLGLLI